MSQVEACPGPRRRRPWMRAILGDGAGHAGPSGAGAESALTSGVWSALVVISLWLATHRYFGIVHDGRLYTVQALRGLDPAHWADDLYFRYGSQDAFTIFSALYAPLVGLVGPGVAHLIGSVAGAALWVLALVVFTTAAFAGRGAWFAAVVGAIVLNAHYGGHSVFGYGEVFLTPRLYAEAFVLLGLGLALRGRPGFAAAALLTAAALHPLMALVGIGVLILQYAFTERRVWLAVGVGAIVGLALAMAGIEPFARVWKVFDPQWFAIIYDRSRLAFETRWGWADGVQVAGTFCVLFAMAQRAPPQLRRMLWALLVVSALGVAASVLGADLARNVLIANLQLWRALWLATLCANACLPVLFLTAPRTGVAREMLLLALVAGGASTFLWVPSLVFWGLAIIASLALLLEVRTGAGLGGVARVALRVIAVALLGLGVVAVSVETGADLFLQDLLSLAIVAGIVALVVCAPRIRSRAVLLALAVLALGVSAARFDARSQWQLFIEAPDAPADLVRFVGDAHDIYWESGPELLWFKLRRPSYFSCVQGAGGIFYRDTAVAYQHRLDALKPLMTRDVTGKPNAVCSFDGMPPTTRPATPAAIADACKRLPELDELVLMQPVRGVPARVWNLPKAQTLPDQARIGKVVKISRVYGYSCDDFR